MAGFFRYLGRAWARVLLCLVIMGSAGMVPSVAKAQATINTDSQGNLINGPAYGKVGGGVPDYWGPGMRKILNGQGQGTGVCQVLKFTFNVLAGGCVLFFLYNLMLSLVGRYDGRQFRRAMVLLLVAGLLAAPYSFFNLVGMNWVRGSPNAPVWTCILG